MIRIYGKRIIEILASNTFVIGLMLLLTTVTFVLTASIYDKQKQSEKIEEIYQEQYGQYEYYWCNEDLDDLDYNYYMYGDTSGTQYNNLIELEKKLWDEKSINFFTCNAQSIDLEDNVNDIFLNGYEDGYTEYDKIVVNGKQYYASKCLFVSDNFLEVNNIKMIEGRVFTEDDHEYKSGENQPVILGNAYSKYYHVGDTFKGEFLGEEFTFEVIGIMDDKSFFLSSTKNDFVSTERYILIPALLCEEDTLPARIMALLNLNGTVQSNIGEENTRKIIDDMLIKENLKWDYVMHNPNSNENKIGAVERYGKMTSQIAGQFKILVILIVIFTVFALLLNIFSIFEKNKYNFGIELMCGASTKDVVFEGIGCIAFVLLISDLCASLIMLKLVNDLNSILILQLIVIGIMIVSFAICYLYIKRMQIGDIIVGRE